MVQTRPEMITVRGGTFDDIRELFGEDGGKRGFIATRGGDRDEEYFMYTADPRGGAVAIPLGHQDVEKAIAAAVGFIQGIQFMSDR